MIAFLFSSRFAVKMNESRIVWSLSKKREVLELEGEEFSQPDEHAKLLYPPDLTLGRCEFYHLLEPSQVVQLHLSNSRSKSSCSLLVWSARRSIFA